MISFPHRTTIQPPTVRSVNSPGVGPDTYLLAVLKWLVDLRIANSQRLQGEAAAGELWL